MRAMFPGKSDTTIQYRNAKGELKFKGSKTLKESQTYPRRFGIAVACWQATWCGFRAHCDDYILSCNQTLFHYSLKGCIDARYDITIEQHAHI